MIDGLHRGDSVYIAGPMTGIPDRNFPLFFSVERALRRAGFRPINPAKNDGPDLESAVKNADTSGFSWSDYMRMDLRHMSYADAVVFLPGSQNSRGAALERHIAEALGMKLYGIRPATMLNANLGDWGDMHPLLHLEPSALYFVWYFVWPLYTGIAEI